MYEGDYLGHCYSVFCNGKIRLFTEIDDSTRGYPKSRIAPCIVFLSLKVMSIGKAFIPTAGS